MYHSSGINMYHEYNMLTIEDAILKNLLLNCWERWMKGVMKICSFFSTFLKSNNTPKNICYKMNYTWFWFILFTFISLRDIPLNSDLGKITWQSFIWSLFYFFWIQKIRLICSLNLPFKDDFFFFFEYHFRVLCALSYDTSYPWNYLLYLTQSFKTTSVSFFSTNETLLTL